MAEKKKYTEYKNSYSAKNYDSLRVVVPKGRKNDIEARLSETGGGAVNRLVNSLLMAWYGANETEWGYKAVSRDE